MRMDRTWHSIVFADGDYLADDNIDPGYRPTVTLDVLEAVRFQSEGAAREWLKQHDNYRAEVVLITVSVAVASGIQREIWR